VFAATGRCCWPLLLALLLLAAAAVSRCCWLLTLQARLHDIKGVQQQHSGAARHTTRYKM
jgi:hypothetical protein